MPLVGPPYGPFAPLVTFFALFLLFGAAAETKQLELIARAAIAYMENFMVVVSLDMYVVMLLIIIDLRELQLYVAFQYYRAYDIVK